MAQEENYNLCEQMNDINLLLVRYGISKSVMAEDIGLSPSSLTNKFSAATAVVNFAEPKSRDRFTHEQAQQVQGWMLQLYRGLCVLGYTHQPLGPTTI